MGVSVVDQESKETQRVLITRLVSAPPEHLSPEAVARIKKWVEPTSDDVRAVMSIAGASMPAKRILRELQAIAEQNENCKQ